MPKSNLPLAKSDLRNIKIGNIEVKMEKPSESPADVQKSLKSLERAARDKVFTENAGLQA